ncbi:MAG: heparinase II/III family protein [Lentisphaeria bacterium]|nr:heparinase II/III family protein [Lentisphaeria bacterium]
MMTSVALTATLGAGGTASDADLDLKASPRLWVSEDVALNLKDKLHTPYLKSQAARVLEDADWLVEAKPVAEGEAGSYQQGTRAIASHLQCLTAAWVLTREPKYRAAAIRHLENLMTWNQVSCEANVRMSHEHQMFFCLSYGEHAADIGLTYDLFRSDITPEEQRVFFDVLDRFYLKEALRSLENPPWWANKSWSNWNGVCAGGMGILALAFYDDRPECRKLIPFVEKSLGEYFKSYIKNGGGCHEGTGYWNYGMHYAMRYLLSWENATGREHPAFQIKELGLSLHFPLDFTGITFGDNDGWHPAGFFFMLAKRLNQPEAALRAATYLPERVESRPADMTRLSRAATGDILYGADFIPTSEEMAALREAHAKRKDPVARVYTGLEWAALADDSVFPSLRLAARGGSSEITGHGHLDLLSFKCMVNGKQMIGDQAGGNMKVNFTAYGHHLYSRGAAAKSTLFVDGLGCRENAVCDETEVVKNGDLLGIRIDGSNIYLPRWRRGFIGRLFLMVENRYWLIVDSAPGHMLESRFHTLADYERGPDWVSLNHDGERMMMTFATLGGGLMQESRGMPSSPRRQTNILRWMSQGSSHDSLQVAALNPGDDKLTLTLSKEKGGVFAILISGPEDYQRTVRLTRTLELKRDQQ